MADTADLKSADLNGRAGSSPAPGTIINIGEDAQAIVLKPQNGLITYTKSLADLGIDFEEAMTERAQEQAFVEALGITLGADIRGHADTAEDDTMDNQPTRGGKPSGTKKPTRARLLELDTDERAALVERARVFYRVIRKHAK